MVLSLRKYPKATCARYITCARDLLLLRDRSYKCSPYKLAVNFDRICSLGNRGNADGLGIPSNDEIEQDPSLLSQFLVYRAMGTEALGQVPHELLEALAAAYLTLSYRSELHDVSYFIKSCFVEVGFGISISPISDSCKIASIRYIFPCARSNQKQGTVYGNLVVEEQCDFEISNELGSGNPYGKKLRLKVEHNISVSNPEEALFSLEVRKVEVVLVEKGEYGLPKSTGRACTWAAAHKHVDRFTITTFGTHSNGMGSALSIYRMQKENAKYLSRRIFANTGTSGGFVRSLLGTLLGIPGNKIRLTYGCTRIRTRGEVMYDVRRRVLAYTEGGGLICGGGVLYGVYGGFKAGSVSLIIDNVQFYEAYVAGLDGFLHEDFVPREACHILPLDCRVTLFGTGLLEDTVKLLEYSRRQLDLSVTAFGAHRGDLAIGR
ncbi:hypothetical protein [Candidatus Anaplasma sp. TIGMIC]|uniref:hypothetical protein n=1 Tax=Candidatus Anaplasma sp. TIGMIC TaxID=3020713 RepID=UPI00232EBFEA|nr:hypothetical protein [Candidatus Anaplasma sp. TIGMIC]MDB1135559.1 hypothetical protein [Candidatus Anaplasma sp. TIGMIC]